MLFLGGGDKNLKFIVNCFFFNEASLRLRINRGTHQLSFLFYYLIYFNSYICSSSGYDLICFNVISYFFTYCSTDVVIFGGITRFLILVWFSWVFYKFLCVKGCFVYKSISYFLYYKIRLIWIISKINKFDTNKLI